MPLLHTARLTLLPADPALAGRVAAFLADNAAHFAPWDPPRPRDFTTEAHQRDVALPAQAAAFAEGSSLRWFLLPAGERRPVLGSVTLSNLARGPLQGCTLGYALDARWQGQGLMHEALQAVLGHAFQGLNLHRVQAAYRPENSRSGAVLRRLGFREIGLAHDHLFIDGAWRHHLLTERLNPGFRLPAEWRP